MGPIPRSSRSLAPHMAQLAGAMANGAWGAGVSAYACLFLTPLLWPYMRIRQCALRECVDAGFGLIRFRTMDYWV